MIFRNRAQTTDYISACLGDGVEIQDISTPSYAFTRRNRNEPASLVLRRTFNIPDNEAKAFDESCRQVSSGQGNESGNLLIVHSSALLGLMCFYRISAEHPLIIPCEGNTYEFDRVFFEVENIVRNKNDRPSCIDIALYSTTQKVLLLLESKFTEPLNGGNLKNVDAKYHNRLKLLTDAGIRYIEKTGKFDCAKVSVGRQRRLIYYEGIKQMVAHLIGAETGPASSSEKHGSREYYARCFDEAGKIFLGTILFDNDILFDDTERSMISEYVGLYSKSMPIIVETIEGKNKGRLHLLTTPFTYQDIFRNINPDFLPPKVSRFYHLEA